VATSHEPKGRASSPLRADGCNHAFLQREERRARSDAPYLIPPVHGTDARPILEVEALHEPNPLTPSLSPTGGEGARRAGEGDSAWFMVPMRGRRTVEASHEPSNLPPGFGVR